MCLNVKGDTKHVCSLATHVLVPRVFALLHKTNMGLCCHDDAILSTVTLIIW